MAAPEIGVHARSRLDELYRAHAAEIYRYVYAVLGNRADAEDVMQTTFVNALRALERGELPRKPAHWLVTIAHNLIRQRFRQQYIRPRQVELDADIPTLEADDSGPSIEDLVRALQRIPETQREALVLRELEGRSYKEIAAILGVSRPALEGLIFRARRSLAEELENLVTCDRAELALSRIADGRLGRKQRRRLVAHLEECSSCARVAALSMKRRHAFKGLALLPLPWSLTFFKGAPSASAAVGLPTIGGTAAAGGTVVGGGIAAKVAIGFAAVAVAGGAGYEGVKAVSAPAAAAPVKAAAVTASPEAAPAAVARRTAAIASTGTPAAKKPHPVKAAAAKSVKGRSATALGHAKAKARPKQKVKTKAASQPQAKPKKPKPVQAAAPRTPPGAAKSEAAKNKPGPAPKPKKELVPPAEVPEPPALPRGPQDDQVLPEVARDRIKGARP